MAALCGHSYGGGTLQRVYDMVRQSFVKALFSNLFHKKWFDHFIFGRYETIRSNIVKLCSFHHMLWTFSENDSWLQNLCLKWIGYQMQKLNASNLIYWIFCIRGLSIQYLLCLLDFVLYYILKRLRLTLQMQCTTCGVAVDGTSMIQNLGKLCHNVLSKKLPLLSALMLDLNFRTFWSPFKRLVKNVFEMTNGQWDLGHNNSFESSSCSI